MPEIEKLLGTFHKVEISALAIANAFPPTNHLALRAFAEMLISTTEWLLVVLKSRGRMCR